MNAVARITNLAGFRSPRALAPEIEEAEPETMAAIIGKALARVSKPSALVSAENRFAAAAARRQEAHADLHDLMTQAKNARHPSTFDKKILEADKAHREASTAATAAKATMIAAREPYLAALREAAWPIYAQAAAQIVDALAEIEAARETVDAINTALRQLAGNRDDARMIPELPPRRDDHGLGATARRIAGAR